MWQFIPETAIKYDLRLGPLVDLRRPDPADDRDNYEKATKAAARYLKDLYCTDAQASGLLVMACYNWGEDHVLPLVRGMPDNPRERNFWRLLSKYRDKMPQETYDYVFYIASAAVIGEDPRLFGFDFDNPLASLETNPNPIADFRTLHGRPHTLLRATIAGLRASPRTTPFREALPAANQISRISRLKHVLGASDEPVGPLQKLSPVPASRALPELPINRHVTQNVSHPRRACGYLSLEC